MGLRSDSVAGVRFLAAVHEGRGIKPAARSVGVHPWTGYRWLREAFLALRSNGLDAEAAQADLGCFTAKAQVWEQEFLAGLGDGRHHLRVRVEVEDIFWANYDQGGSLSTASALAGVGRSTGYRWLQARFTALRDCGMSRAVAARKLRLSRGRSQRWELERRQYQRDVARSRVKAERHAIRDSGRHVQLLELARKPSHRTVQLVELETRYWELMRDGISNAAACRLLGMHRKSGTRIRKNSHHQTLGPKRPAPNSGRYLSLTERLQIADLERLGYSIRKISIELGRHPSTVKRELDRNRDKHGRYLPHGADDAALPRHLEMTLTWYQGTEMSRHLERAAATGIDIYFAERSSPWQRGANENFNGLLRQYFTKGTDLSIHSHAHVAHVMEELNTRPRKLLGYRTPKQALHAEKRPPTVTFKSLDRRPKSALVCNYCEIPLFASGNLHRAGLLVRHFGRTCSDLWRSRTRFPN